jgi:methionyl-tRNA formyltransferase
MAKIVFFGNEQLVQGLDKSITPTFDGLIASHHQVAALVLPRQSKATSRKARTLEIIDSANRHNIEIIYAETVDLPQTLRKLNADIGALVSYGKIVPQAVIDAFPNGIINLHPSLLPKYRGPTPLEATILNGDSETGVSLMALTAQMDAGPIYAQAKIALSPDETKFTLYKKAIITGSQLLLTNLDNILSGQLKPTDQADTQATFTNLLTKADGQLDPTTTTATDCERKIRAFLGFPKTRLSLLGQEIIITKAQALTDFNGDDWPDIIKCAGNTYLQIKEIVSSKSGKTMPTADYLRGLRLI